MDLLKISLFASTFLTGLIAGLFYSYSCSVNLGVSKLSDLEYLKAMKSINKEILNPWFFLSFTGSFVVIPLTTWLYYQSNGPDTSCYLLLGASIVYMVGVFGLTIVGNVPLNNSLDRLELGRVTQQEIKAKRFDFEIPWNRFHFIRMLANVVAFAILVLAIVNKFCV
jgi:uncharacterized membrane protein